MQPITEILREIRSFKRERGLTNSRLARDAGLHENTLRDIDKPKWNPRVRTVEKLQRRITRLREREPERAA